MNRSLRRLDVVHQKLLDTVRPLDTKLFRQRPSDNEWSVAEVIEHLCLVEGAVMNYLESKLDQPPVKISFLKKFFPMWIVGLRFKRLQAPERVRPASELPPMNELLRKYDQQRKRTKQICNEAGERLNGIRFKHPYFGDMDGAAAVSMVAYHEQRHLKQIREILKKLSN